MYKKLLILLFTIPFILLNFYGCNQNNEKINNNSNQDDQYYFYKPTILNMSMAESNDGYYFFSGPNNQYLYYMDKTNMKPVVLCNKPDCLHVNEIDSTKKSSCNAFFSFNSSLIYNDTNLYLFDDHNNCLYSVSLDGTQRRVIFEFKEMPQYAILHKGYIYYITNDNGTIAGNENSTATNCSLYRINMSNLSVESELLYKYSGIYGNIGNLKGYNTSIFFSFHAYKDSTLSSYEAGLLKFDIEGCDIINICQDVGHFSICGDRIVYYWVDGHNYECNLDGSNKRLLKDVIGLTFDDNKYIITDTLFMKLRKQTDIQGNNIKRQINFHDLDGNLIQSFDIDLLGKNNSYGGNMDFFFIPDDYSKKNQYGYIKSLWVINKKNIAEHKAKLEKIFEFSPVTEEQLVIDNMQ